MTNKIFISRNAHEAESLTKIFNGDRFKWTCEQLLTFSAVPFEDPWTEWLYFYSKNGVKYYYLNKPTTRLRTHKLACFGSGTANFLFDLTGHLPDLVGSGEKEANANQLIETIGTDTICFVRGETSMNSIQKILGPHENHSDLIVYKNTPRTHINLQKFDIAIITSPLNYDSFVNNGGTAENIITLGDTTCAYILQKHPKQKCHKTKEPSMSGISEKLQLILQQPTQNQIVTE